MADNNISRRSLFHTTAAGAGLVLAGSLTGCDSGDQDDNGQDEKGKQGGKAVKLTNADFYDAAGAFQGAKAKQAFYNMMEAFGYPISAVLKTDEFWAADFLQRDFETLGMGGIFWVNESGKYGETGAKAYTGDFKGQNFGYLGHEIYLLPGQMLPEHRHVGGEGGFGPKMESWHVRYGSAEFFGEHKGAGDETAISDLPASQRPFGFGEDWFKSKYVAKREAGKMYKLLDPETWHFLRAGPDGVIVSEYATYHNQVEFSKPDMEFDSSKAKTAPE